MAKLNKTDIKMMEILNAGTQPNFAELNFQATSFRQDYLQALNWIHNNVDQDVLRTELSNMLIQRDAQDDAQLVSTLDGVQISVLGKIAYCINRGAQLADSSILRVTGALSIARQRQTTTVVDTHSAFEEQEQTAAGRVNAAYKACYSRLDNLRALVNKGDVELDDVADQVRLVLDAQGGTRAQVRKRLVEHYTQSLNEALADKALKSWVKPLQEILIAVGGDAQAVKAKAKKAATNTQAAAVKAKAAPKKAAAKKAVKAPKTNKVITIKPPLDKGAPSVASQVRDLISVNKASVDEAGMIEIVISQLGLSKERGRSVVRAFWNKVEAA